MNNIEILEEKIKIIESLCTDDCINKSTVIQPLKYAIENLIQENKKLKKQMGKDLDVIYIKGAYDERDKWENKIKEKIDQYKDIQNIYCMSKDVVKILESLL